MNDKEVTVPVPEGRVPEFYQWFGRWLDGSIETEPLPGGSGVSQGDLRPWGDTDEELTDAAALWKKYSPRARAMFSLLIDNPGKEFTGEQIAEAADIPHGAHGVAGVLAWPGRYGNAVGRGLPSDWREDPETGEGYYGMSEERAALFQSARELVDGHNTSKEV